MRSPLFDYEWQFLIQMVTRIHYTSTYEELCQLLLEDQLPALIPFSRAVVFQTARKEGQGVICEPYPVRFISGSDKNPFLSRKVIPLWSQFIMVPHSTVFLQSDLIASQNWEQTDLYKEVWAPSRLYWGLGASIQYRDTPLALVALFRDKGEPDFSAKEFYILHSLKDALERKFFSLLVEGVGSGDLLTTRIQQAASEHGLTKRETEIIGLICRNLTTEEICEKLFLAPATLSKHLSNIYGKLELSNRIQLMSLFNQ